MAVHQAVRRAPARPDARPGSRRDRPRPRRGRRRDPDGHHRPRARRRARGDRGRSSTRVWSPPSGTPRPPTSRPGRRSTAGATVGTHLFNAMRPIDRREPGPDRRAARRPAGDRRADHRRRARRSRHLPPRHAQRRARPGVAGDRCDGGHRDGRRRYHLGPLAVDVVDGVARVAGTDTIAGSTATMDRVFRFAVAALRAAPATRRCCWPCGRRRSIPRGHWGCRAPDSSPGAAADLVVLDSELRRGGRAAPGRLGRRARRVPLDTPWSVDGDRSAAVTIAAGGELTMSVCAHRWTRGLPWGGCGASPARPPAWSAWSRSSSRRRA